MDNPFNSVERFDERLAGYASRDGWEVVIAYQADEPAGYIFGSPLMRGSLWWSSMRQPQPDEFTQETGSRTFAVQEVLVREAFRSTAGAGTSRRCTRRSSPSGMRSAPRSWSIPPAPRDD